MKFVNQKLVEFNQYLKNRKVAVIGLGVSNIPLIEYLHSYKANVTIFDNKEIDNIDKSLMDTIVSYGMEFHLGSNNLSHLKGFDIIFRSPSCLPSKKELEAEAKRGAIITTEVEMVIELCPGKVIGVTGSDGKTTTTTLINEILKEGNYKTYLGGNIGTPLFTKIGEMTPEDIVVLELSSFQLMGMKVSPQVSVITNISPNHLDIHNSMEEYVASKMNIFLNQDENSKIVLNSDNSFTEQLISKAKGTIEFFSSHSKLEKGYIVDDKKIKYCEEGLRKHILDTKDLQIKGIHNHENICAALAATSSFVSLNTAVKAITNFKGVEHRIEFVKETNEKVKWYNDSVSSSPTRTIAGLNAFDKKVILIAGGYDKNLDYAPLAKPILYNVKTLILLGQTADKIKVAVEEEMKHVNRKVDIYKCDSLEQTIALANRLSLPGDTILFSPASASFDMFKNAVERGNIFKELVHKMV